jgi:hypothetical protein
MHSLSDQGATKNPSIFLLFLIAPGFMSRKVVECLDEVGGPVVKGRLLHDPRGENNRITVRSIHDHLRCVVIKTELRIVSFGV